MAINYSKIGWDTTKYVNPTNMNQMDNGIKAACDGVDAISGDVYLERNIAWASTAAHSVDDAPVGTELVFTNHGAPTTGMLLTVAGSGTDNSKNFKWQMMSDFTQTKIYARSRNGGTGTWAAWKEIALKEVSTYTAGNFSVAKTGCVATLVMTNGTVTTDASGFILVNNEQYTLPAEYRPKFAMNFVESYGNIRMTIATDGKIYLPTKPSATGLTIRFGTTYVTAS